jgi:CHAD domain-containing protein
LRIKSKHLRYAAEAFACVCDDAATDFAKVVEELQTILGDQHDGVVAMKRLREMKGSGDLRFTAGELAMLSNEASCKGRAQWREAWRRVRRKDARFWRPKSK